MEEDAAVETLGVRTTASAHTPGGGRAVSVVDTLNNSWTHIGEVRERCLPCRGKRKNGRRTHATLVVDQTVHDEQRWRSVRQQLLGQDGELSPSPLPLPSSLQGALSISPIRFSYPSTHPPDRTKIQGDTAQKTLKSALDLLS